MGDFHPCGAPSASKTLARFVEPMGSNSTNLAVTKKPPSKGASFVNGGEGGIQLARFATSLPTCRYAAALVERDSKSATTLDQNEQGPHKGALFVLAERVGFEPTVRENRTPDFESGPFDHSGTSP